MTAQPGATGPEVAGRDAPEISKLYPEGTVTGVIGVVTIAIRFLIVDR